MNTAWATDWGKHDENPWVQIEFASPWTVSQLRYANRDDAGRNRVVRLEFSDGSSTTVTLNDDGDLGTFDLPEPKLTSFVKIVVVSCYGPPGDTYNGAKEIELLGPDEGGQSVL